MKKEPIGTKPKTRDVVAAAPTKTDKTWVATGKRGYSQQHEILKNRPRSV